MITVKVLIQGGGVKLDVTFVTILAAKTQIYESYSPLLNPSHEATL